MILSADKLYKEASHMNWLSEQDRKIIQSSAEERRWAYSSNFPFHVVIPLLIGHPNVEDSKTRERLSLEEGQGDNVKFR